MRTFLIFRKRPSSVPLFFPSYFLFVFFPFPPSFFLLGSCSTRLLAESCVYATFQVRSVNQLDRRSSPTPGLYYKNADPAVHKEEIHVLYISDKTGNIIQTTDLKITLVFAFFFLSPYFGLKMFNSFPSLIPSQFHFY